MSIVREKETVKENLFWVDCEMTGLEPDTCVIIEIASIVTDSVLNVLAEGPAIVIQHPQTELDKMDAWNQKHHRASGLYDRVLASTVSLREAEVQTLAFAKQHGGARKMPLCGNSIWQDRRFLAKHMPELEQFLHYRIVDVSSFKEVVKRWYPSGITPTKKKESHRALDDIRESIFELQFYRKHYMIAPELAPKTVADLEAKDAVAAPTA